MAVNRFLSLSFQIAVWNSYKGMNLTETNRDKNNNVTDSLANRTLIVTTILVRKEVKQRAARGTGGEWRETERGRWRMRDVLVVDTDHPRQQQKKKYLSFLPCRKIHM